jgi:hypothetical protein
MRFCKFAARDHPSSAGYVRRAHVFRLARVQRRGTLRAVAINRDRFQPEPPAFDVGVHDVVDGGVLRQLTVLEIAPLRNGCAAAIIRRCAM